MSQQTIRARYLGSIDKPTDLLGQARLIQSAALRLYREARTEARLSLVKKAVAIRRMAHRSGRMGALRRYKKEFEERHKYLDRLYVETIRRANRDCLKLSIAIAEEVVGGEVQVNHESLVRRITNSLERIVLSGSAEVVTNPQVQNELGHRTKNKKQFSDIHFTSSEHIEPGTALIKSAAGEVELNWRLELRQIAQKLLDDLDSKIEGSNSSIQDKVGCAPSDTEQ